MQIVLRQFLTQKYEPGRVTLSLLFAKNADQKVAIKNSDKNIRNVTKKHKEAIVNYLAENSNAKCSDISMILGIKDARCRRILADMISEKIVETEGGNRNRVYRLIR